MEPKIVHKDQLILLGLSFYGDPFQSSAGWTEENEIGRLWKRFMVFWERHKEEPLHVIDPDSFYEVHLDSDERITTGNYEVFVGTAVSHIENIPTSALVKVLPTTTYAVFTLHGEQITSDWHQLIYHEWLPGSGYEIVHGYSIQLYDHRFKGMNHLSESTLDIYMPIQKRTT